MSTLYKRKNSPFYWWTTCYKGRRLRKSTRMTKLHIAIKVKEFWDLCLIKGEIGFLGLNLHPDIQLNKYIFHYLKFLESRKSSGTVSITNGVLKQFLSYGNKVGIKRLDEIKATFLNGYIDWLKCAPKTKKNHLSILSLMFDQAIKEEVIMNNPARLATLPMIKKVVRHRMLESTDLDIIFENPGNWFLYYLWLHQTGLRAGDVAMLTNENIDRNKRVIVNFIRKSRRMQEFPLADILIEKTPQGANKEPLFPDLYSFKYADGEIVIDEKQLHYRISKPRIHMQNVLDTYGRPSATLHSFRVTFNNTLRDLGLAIQDRQVLLAHSSSETTKIYTHPNVELAREFVNRIPIPNSPKIM